MFRASICMFVVSVYFLAAVTAAPVTSNEPLQPRRGSSDSTTSPVTPGTQSQTAETADAAGATSLAAAAAAAEAAAAAAAASGDALAHEADLAAARTPSVFCRCFPWPSGALKVPPRTDLRATPATSPATTPAPTATACAPPATAARHLSTEAN